MTEETKNIEKTPTGSQYNGQVREAGLTNKDTASLLVIQVKETMIQNHGWLQ